MSLAILYSRASVGLNAPLVTIEVHLAKGMPGLSIVGLPEAAVKESRHRVRSALVNSQFEFPIKRITINLAPADLPKEGGRFDLPIALGILAASAQIPKNNLTQYEFAGELALTGELRPIKGILPFAISTQKQKRQLFICEDNALEAMLAHRSHDDTAPIYAARHLLDVCNHLANKQTLTPFNFTQQQMAEQNAIPHSIAYPDLADVYGQPNARRALEIAAAGGHSLLLIGPPGSGKTMLASRLPGILPPLTEDEAQEVASIYSLNQSGFSLENWKKRPFRSPHHTTSAVAMVGGSQPPRPGEISLAHHGILFLDELPEFNRHVLETLREPLEAGKINISRAAYQAEFPARFQLITAMNPCPCGYYGDPNKDCQCTADQVKRYQSRISGPLLDRIDIHLQVPAVTPELLLNQELPKNESSANVANRIISARETQLNRQGILNSQLESQQINQHCTISQPERDYLIKAMNQLGISARAFHRVLKLARTIADLDHHPTLQQCDLQEALYYRSFIKTGVKDF